MRNKLISIIAICLSFSLLTGCGSGQAKGSGNEEPAVNTVESAQEVTASLMSRTRTKKCRW